MAGCGNYILLDQNLSADTTMLTLGKACSGTSRCYCLVGYLGVTLGVDLGLFNSSNAANSTLLAFGQTGCGTSCILAGNDLFAMALGIYIVSYIGITARTGIGCITLFCTGRLSDYLVISMAGCGNFITSFDNLTASHAHLITGIAIFRTGCRLLVLNLRIEMLTNCFSAYFLITYCAVYNRIVRTVLLILNNRRTGCMILSSLYHITAGAQNRCCAVAVIRLRDTFVNNLKVTVIGGSAEHCAGFQVERVKIHHGCALSANLLGAIGAGHNGNYTNCLTVIRITLSRLHGRIINVNLATYPHSAATACLQSNICAVFNSNIASSCTQ